MGRSVDAGGPVWVGAPDDDGGVSVLARFETLNIEQRSVTLVLQLGERDDDDGELYPTSDPEVLLTCILDTGECRPDEPRGRAFLASHPWFEERFQQHMDHVRHRAWRAVAQRDRDTAARRQLQTATGTMVAFHDLFPADWDLLFGIEGAVYWVVDQYCPNPACPCSSVALTLHELGDGAPVALGEATLDLARDPPRLEVESVTSAATRELFATFFDEHLDRLRERRNEARRVVVRFAAHTRGLVTSPSTSRPTRNDPCPCGSGKKYKRCCLTTAERTSSALRS